MKRAILLLALATAGIPSCAAAAPAGPVIYPAKGQPPMQQDRDRYECHDWARAQSGYDPAQPQQPGTPSQQPGPAGGPSLNEMARGAASGAAVAELSNHDAGRGAAAGIAASSVVARVREQQAMQARQAQQASQLQAGRNQARSIYERGFAACMEARGYVVK